MSPPAPGAGAPAFEGAIEDLAVTDIIQLLHVSRKSGTLELFHRDLEATLAFENGEIVSAGHPLAGINVGFILLEQGALDRRRLLAALRRQEQNAANKPLVATLLELGTIDRAAGWRALARLVEETVAEVVSWRTGRFSFSLGEVRQHDDFHHFPPELRRELPLDTQQLLIGALDIIDGQREARSVAPPPATAAASRPPAARTVPAPVREPEERPSHPLVDLSDLQPERLLSRLDDDERPAGDEAPAEARVQIHSIDAQMAGALDTICLEAGLDAALSDTVEETLAALAARVSDGETPALVTFWSPGDDDAPRLTERVRREWPHLPQLAVCAAADDEARAFCCGARAVIRDPRGAVGAEADAAADRFARALGSCLGNHLALGGELTDRLRRSERQLRALSDSVRQICAREERQDITLVVLRYVAEYLERCVVFLVRERDLLALGAFGVDEGGGPARPGFFRVDRALCGPLTAEAIEHGTMYVGEGRGDELGGDLPAGYAGPRCGEVILLPLRVEDRTIALIYGSFGAGCGSPIHADVLQVLACSAGLALELELGRRRDLQLGEASVV